MNRIYLILLSFSFVLNVSAQSPIVLGNVNMPGGNDSLRYSNAKLASVGNYTATGANYNWDFSGLEFNSQGVRAYKPAPLTPYAFFFSFQDYGEKVADTLGAGAFTMTDFYLFYKKQTAPAAYIADGVGLKYNGIPIPNYYSDKDELYKFPMTYPKYDSTTFKFSTTTNSMVPFKYSKTGYRITVVDGWGTITTPFGTANCLRLITTQYSQDSLKTQFGSVGGPNYQRSYQWLTLTDKIPYLEISGALNGTNFTPGQVRYRDSVRAVVGINEYSKNDNPGIYPNPVKEVLGFNLKANENYLFEIFDMSGKKIYVREEKVIGEKANLNLKDLQPGLYTLKISRPASVRLIKFIKE